MIKQELKDLNKELKTLTNTIEKTKSQLDNHQKEHQRHELRAQKEKKAHQEKMEKIQVTANANIEEARKKEQLIVPLMTREMELKAQIEILEKVNV